MLQRAVGRDRPPAVASLFGDYIRFPGAYASQAYVGEFVESFLPSLASHGVLTRNSLCFVPNGETGELHDALTSFSHATRTPTGTPWSKGSIVVKAIQARDYPLFNITAALSAEVADLPDPAALTGLHSHTPFLLLSSP
jgi:hypothetical protein